MRFLAVPLVGLVFTGLPIEQSAAAQTKTYVLSWIVPAMYAYEGDCQIIEPVADPGSSPVESMYRRALLQTGVSAKKIDELMADEGEDALGNRELYDMILNRGRVEGEPVNIFQNPAAAPDPQVTTVKGKYAIGFNLDGKGAQSPDSFEDPYTHEKGVDNQYYRAAGCFRSSRVTAPERSGHWQEVWDSGADEGPAFLISITGEDLSRDGEVAVHFRRAIERPRSDALSKVRRDMTFRVDPNPLTQATLPGRIQNGTLIVEGGHLQIGGRFITTPFDLTNTHLRLKILPDGSLEGLLAGYQPWLTLYHWFYGWKLTIEGAFGINVSAAYYALKKLADADPDPLTKENRRISITYAIQAVPAFAAPARVQEPTQTDPQPRSTIASASGRTKPVPLATPPGVTIQIPASAERDNIFFGAYRARSPEIQYLADARGMTLYTYEHDKPNKSTCYKECAKAWPPLMAPRNAKAFGDWSLVRRRDGGKQWAYLGKPLYRFARDQAIGEIGGAPRPLDPAEERRKAQFANVNDKVEDKDEIGKESSPWKLASYKLPGILSPHGIQVAEIADANGEILVERTGRALYVFDGDPNRDGVECQSAPCIDDWIPLEAGRVANPIGDFTLIKRNDGNNQWAYQGKGLYTFRGDLETGHVKGLGVDPRWRPAMVRRYYLPPRVQIRESLGRGKVLADERGMTLYRRSASAAEAKPRSVPVYPDEGRDIGTRSCDAQCMKTWIPFEAPADAQPGGFWEVLTREDGKKQWSYKGYALYRYAGDQRPGDVNGNFLYEIFPNRRLQKTPLDAASRVASSVRITANVALLWSHMYP